MPTRLSGCASVPRDTLPAAKNRALLLLADCVCPKHQGPMPWNCGRAGKQSPRRAPRSTRTSVCRRSRRIGARVHHAMQRAWAHVLNHNKLKKVEISRIMHAHERLENFDRHGSRRAELSRLRSPFFILAILCIIYILIIFHISFSAFYRIQGIGPDDLLYFNAPQDWLRSGSPIRSGTRCSHLPTSSNSCSIALLSFSRVTLSYSLTWFQGYSPFVLPEVSCSLDMCTAATGRAR